MLAAPRRFSNFNGVFYKVMLKTLLATVVPHFQLLKNRVLRVFPSILKLTCTISEQPACAQTIHLKRQKEGKRQK
jgi:hypothetical protein